MHAVVGPISALARAHFMRAGLAASIAAVAMAQLAHAQGLDLAARLREADPDGQCAQAKVIGQCTCAGVVCGVRIYRYVPVAFIETTVAPGDTLLGALGVRLPRLFGTISSALSTTDNTAEAHVWRLPGPLAAMATGMPCLGCLAANAAVPTSAAADAAAAVCGPAAEVSQATQAAAGRLGDAIPVPVLSYVSELDWINWRTGCRDQFEFAAQGAPALPACALAGNVADPVVAAPGADSVAGEARAACVGQWGPLRPRQMRDIGPTPLLYSAKTAVRAMSIAREQLGSFPFPVDTQGKLQQVYPVISACFGVGALPLPALPLALRPVATSADGRYGWIYWRPASCCIGLSGAAQCLRGMLLRP